MDLQQISKIALTEPDPSVEIKVAKIGLDLYLGQVLKAQVVNSPQENEVTITINGQNINAKTTQHFTPGETLDVKVIDNKDEIVLQVQPKPLTTPEQQKIVLQNALLQTLPKQAPPTNLLTNLKELVDSNKLPPAVNEQVKNLLTTITPLAQLPTQLAKAIQESGAFLESALLAWQPGMPAEELHADVKAQYLKILDNLPDTLKADADALNTLNNQSTAVKRDTLPLPGAIPQPLSKEPTPTLLDKSPATVQAVIHEQVDQALSRITASQINNLSTDPSKNGFVIMVDIPVRTNDNMIDVIPLMIKQRQASSKQQQQSQWSISFALSLSELGDMQATVSLDGDAINVKMNVDNPATVGLLAEHQETINQLLNEQGLKLNQFNVQYGLENNRINTENLHLLDIRI